MLHEVVDGDEKGTCRYIPKRENDEPAVDVHVCQVHMDSCSVPWQGAQIFPTQLTNVIAPTGDSVEIGAAPINEIHGRAQNV